ncbi:putative nicotianamine synthase [Xylogone sp. PMI_703]|nr:putative nicotianamine synthase [Xylogone sp. PMI_703]
MNSHIYGLIPALRQICGTAEYYLESYWADLISQPVTEGEVQKSLRNFPYYSNYVDLTRMELGAIYAVRQTAPNRIAFLGSGPLPLTSLCLCQALTPKSPAGSKSRSSGPVVLNIDCNSQAISQSQLLCSKLGAVATGMQFLCADAGSSTIALEEFDVVYLAALVGQTTEEKERVLLNVTNRMSAGSLLIIRTAHSLRKLLYPEFDTTSKVVQACLDVCLVVHPYNHIVNSVIVGRVRGKH